MVSGGLRAMLMAVNNAAANNVAYSTKFARPTQDAGSIGKTSYPNKGSAWLVKCLMRPEQTPIVLPIAYRYIIPLSCLHE